MLGCVFGRDRLRVSGKRRVPGCARQCPVQARHARRQGVPGGRPQARRRRAGGDLRHHARRLLLRRGHRADHPGGPGKGVPGPGPEAPQGPHGHGQEGPAALRDRPRRALALPGRPCRLPRAASARAVGPHGGPRRGQAVPRARDPAHARPGGHGGHGRPGGRGPAGIHQRGDRGPALRHGGAGLRARGKALQHQLPQAAGRDPVRRDEAARGEKDQDRVLHGQRGPGGAGGTARAPRHDPGLAHAHQAQEHLRGHPARHDRPGTGRVHTGSTRPSPPRAGSRPPSPTSRTSPSAPTWAAASGRPSGRPRGSPS